MQKRPQPLKVYHLAPASGSRTGVATFADLFEKAILAYGGDEVELLRMDVDGFSSQIDSLPSNAVVLCQLGVNEGAVYRTLVMQRARRPDLRRMIVVHDPPLLTKTPFSLFEQLGRYRVTRGIRHGANKVLAKAIVSRLVGEQDRFLCLTEHGATLLKGELSRSGFLRAPQVLPHPNYDQFFTPPPENSPAGTPLRVGFFGFITPSKQLDLLVSAAAWIQSEKGPDAVPHIQVYGDCGVKADEVYRAKVLALVKANRLDARITFHGFLPEGNIRARLSSLDVLALPYATNLGSASGPLAWARTCGIPSVTSDSAVLRSQVGSSGTGLFVPHASPESWGQTLSSPDLRPRLAVMRARGSAAFQESSWATVCTRWLTGSLQPLEASPLVISSPPSG